MTKFTHYIILISAFATMCASKTLAATGIADTIVITDTKGAPADSIGIRADSISTVDSVGKKQIIDDPVKKNADSAIVYNISKKKIYMYKNAVVSYKDKEIKADYIEFDSEKKTIYATCPNDTSKNKRNVIFKDGGDSYEIKELYYNFDSQKARIIGVITQQGEAFMHGNLVKKMPDNTMYAKDGRFTTCDAEHPHFYIQMRRSKMIPAKKEKKDKDGKVIEKGKKGQILFDFSYLVVEDVPLPIFLPFGFFPIMTENTSGVLIPSYGEENERGFYLQGFGYYFLLGDYADLTVTGDWYSKGSWALNAASRYTKRYKFSGSLNFQLSKIKLGDKGSPDYSSSNSYSISWSHTKAPQTNPTTNFQANVNFSSSSHKRYNDKDMNNYMTNTASSSISFSKNWEGTPFSLTTSFNHSQNMRDSTYSFGFPNFTFSMSKMYPFKKKNRIGKKKFYEEIGISFNTNFSNSVSNVKEKQLLKKEFWEKMQNGMRNSFSISLPSFTLAKHITVSPGVSYGQNLYFQKMGKKWDEVSQKVISDTTSNFGAFGMSHTYSTGISFSTRIYGLFDKFGKNSKIKAIRHVITPSVSVSYTPNQRIGINGWKRVQTNSAGDMMEYNIYDTRGNINRPSGGKASGNVSFSIGNTLEMKIKSKSDTSENGEKKIKILESLNISASYNMLADSMKLSDINFSGRSNILDKIGINFGFRLNPYEINGYGQRINRYYWKKKLGLGELTYAQFSTDYTFSGGNGKGTGGGTKAVGAANQIGDDGMPKPNQFQHDDHDQEYDLNTPYYVNFDVPWSLSLGFTYSYNKSHNYNPTTKMLKTIKTHSPTLDIRGDLSLTENWKISASTGYDLNAKKITTSQFSLHRDLHCFEFSFSWIPFGYRKSWTFTIRAKSSILRDAIKYDKHSSFYDNY